MALSAIQVAVWLGCVAGAAAQTAVQDGLPDVRSTPIANGRTLSWFINETDMSIEFELVSPTVSWVAVGVSSVRGMVVPASGVMGGPWGVIQLSLDMVKYPGLRPAVPPSLRRATGNPPSWPPSANYPASALTPLQSYTPLADDIRMTATPTWDVLPGGGCRLRFSRSLESGGDVDDMTIDPEEAMWIVVSHGNDGVFQPGYHGPSNRQGLLLVLGASCPVVAGALDDDGKLFTRTVHGVTMFMGWGLASAAGVFVARYCRHKRWWIETHIKMQSAASVGAISALILAVGVVQTQLAHWHAMLGLVVTLLTIGQVGMGWYIHHERMLRLGAEGGSSRCEDYAALGHRVLGRCLFVSAIVNAFEGLALIGATSAFSLSLGLFLSIVFVVFVIAEIHLQITSRRPEALKRQQKQIVLGTAIAAVREATTTRKEALTRTGDAGAATAAASAAASAASLGSPTASGQGSKRKAGLSLRKRGLREVIRKYAIAAGTITPTDATLLLDDTAGDPAGRPGDGLGETITAGEATTAFEAGGDASRQRFGSRVVRSGSSSKRGRRGRRASLIGSVADRHAIVDTAAVADELLSEPLSDQVNSLVVLSSILDKRHCAILACAPWLRSQSLVEEAATSLAALPVFAGSRMAIAPLHATGIRTQDTVSRIAAAGEALRARGKDDGERLVESWWRPNAKLLDLCATAMLVAHEEAWAKPIEETATAPTAKPSRAWASEDSLSEEEDSPAAVAADHTPTALFVAGGQARIALFSLTKLLDPPADRTPGGATAIPTSHGARGPPAAKSNLSVALALVTTPDMLPVGRDVVMEAKESHGGEGERGEGGEGGLAPIPHAPSATEAEDSAQAVHTDDDDDDDDDGAFDDEFIPVVCPFVVVRGTLTIGLLPDDMVEEAIQAVWAGTRPLESCESGRTRAVTRVTLHPGQRWSYLRPFPHAVASASSDAVVIAFEPKAWADFNDPNMPANDVKERGMEAGAFDPSQRLTRAPSLIRAPSGFNCACM